MDGIPHLAFLDKDSSVITALVGEVPKSILVEDVVALIKGVPLPVQGFDAFKDQSSHQPFASSNSATTSNSVSIAVVNSDNKITPDIKSNSNNNEQKSAIICPLTLSIS